MNGPKIETPAATTPELKNLKGATLGNNNNSGIEIIRRNPANTPVHELP